MTDLPPVGRRGWQTVVLASVVVFMVSVEITIISLAFPEIRARFPDASESTLSWIITGYSIGVASLLLIGGWLAERYGLRRAFMAGIALFGFGSLLSGLAQSPEWLIAARVVQSSGGALQYPAGLALVLVAVPRARHQLALGIWGATGALAAAAGPTLGALLVEGFGWRAVFLINVPVVVVALMVSQRLLVDGPPTSRKEGADLVSVPLASLGVGAMILGIVQGQSWGWTSVSTLGVFTLSVLLVAAFVLRSHRHPAPLFDLGLFKLRTFTVANIAAVFFSIGFFSWLVTLPTLIQGLWGWSVLKTGFAIAPGPFLSFLIAPQAGRLADRIGNRPLLVVSGASGAIGLLLFSWQIGAEPEYWTAMFLPSMFIGIAAGTGFSQLAGGAMRDVAPNQYAMAGAGRSTIFQLGVAMAIAIGLAVVGRPATPAATLDAYDDVWLVGAVCYAAMACSVALFYPGRKPISEPQKESR